MDRLSRTTWISLPRVGFDGLAQEGQELGAGALRVAVGHDRAGGDVQGGEQVRRAVPLVVVGAFLGHPEVDRQQRLGPVQRLDLGLLVERQHDRPGRRVQVQADHVERPCPRTADRATA